MDTELKCEFCNKVFSSKSNLNTHKFKAKYCISSRNTEKLTPITYKCIYCYKCFTTKQFLCKHETKCTNKNSKQEILLLEDKLKQQKQAFEIKLLEKDTILQDKEKENRLLREQIESLQQKLENIAIQGVKKHSQIINNNTNITQILSPFDLDQKDILGIIEKKLDETSFLNSQRGIAKFCVENLLKTQDGKMRMICSDPVRERFKYLDEDGLVKEDIQARQFIEKIYPPIHQVGEKIHENILEKCKTIKEKIAKGEDSTDKYIVGVKEEAAHNSWMDIRLIKSQNSNGKFRKELAILSNV